MLKRTISCLLAMLMVITSAPIAIADDPWDDNAGGGGSTGNVGGGTFSIHNQGLRVSLYNKDEPLEALGAGAVVDVWYNGFPTGATALGGRNNKKGVSSGGESSKALHSEEGLSDMPMPIRWDNATSSFIPNGTAIREYLLGDDSYGQTPPSGGSSGGSGGGSGSGGSSGGTPILGFGSSSGGTSTPTAGELMANATNAEERAAAVDKLISSNVAYITIVVNREIDKIAVGEADPPQDVEYKLETIRSLLIQEARDDFQFKKEELNKLIGELDARIAEEMERYKDKYYGTSSSSTEVLGDYVVNLEYQEITDEIVPLAEGARDNGEKMTQFLKACYGDVVDGEQLAAIINATPDVKVLIEPMVAYRPVGLNGTVYDFYYGTPANIGEFNLEYDEMLGNNKGALMQLLTNMALPNSMIVEREDIPLGITPPAAASTVTSDAMASEDIGWGLHIYSKMLSTGTSTWDEDKFPDGTPGPAPTSIPEDASESEKELLKETCVGAIVKFYEEESEPVSNFVRENTDISVIIEDEPEYTLSDWFISPDRKFPSSQSDKYDDTKSSCTVYQEGGAPETVSIAPPNTTLYLLLTKASEEETILQDFRLNESELTRAFNNATVYGQPNWDYAHLWTWIGNSLEPRTSRDYFGFRITDSSLKFFVELTNLIGQSVAKANTGAFAPKDISGVSKTRTSAFTTSPFDVQNLLHFVVYRFKDKPTLAEFKTSPAIQTLLKPLFPYVGNVPKGIDRYNDGRSYMDNISMTIGQSGKSDIYTKGRYKYWRPPTKKRKGKWIYRSTSSYHSTNPFSFSGVLQTLVYHRLPHLTKTGQVTDSRTFDYDTETGWGTGVTKNTEHTNGWMMQTSPLTFYPYVRMTYQKTGQYTVKNDAYVLSEAKSVIYPNDYFEAGWVTKNEEESLHMYSQQWSIHGRATRPTNDGSGSGAIVRPWAGKNQVLPGGAMYDLTTDNTESVVTVGTWQTVVPDVACHGNSKTMRELFTEQGTVFGSSDYNSYTVDSASEAHLDLVEDAANALETLKIVQWVNTDTQADKAWSNVRGNRMKVYYSVNGLSLTPINLMNKTKTDTKYYLKADNTGTHNNINEGDIDIIETTAYAYVYKVSADTSGNFYLQRAKIPNDDGALVISQSEIDDAIETLARRVPGSGDLVLKKDQSVSSLDPFAVELEQKTKIFSNLDKALERNTGGDNSASWAPDGKWYNEAIDGIFIVRQITSFEVGLDRPEKRVAVLDPNLCPMNLGIADFFSKAHLSQFRMDDHSEYFKSATARYLGKFKGREATLVEMENLLQSKKFYIPNVNVQDLLGLS